jgi:hypothetical protein
VCLVGESVHADGVICNIRTCIHKIWILLLDIRIYICIRVIIAVIIRYPQIDNGLILNAFKNKFDWFLVFWICFENIMQYQKHVELRKKWDDRYDLKYSQ